MTCIANHLLYFPLFSHWCWQWVDCYGTDCIFLVVVSFIFLSILFVRHLCLLFFGKLKSRGICCFIYFVCLDKMTYVCIMVQDSCSFLYEEKPLVRDTYTRESHCEIKLKGWRYCCYTPESGVKTLSMKWEYLWMPIYLTF